MIWKLMPNDRFTRLDNPINKITYLPSSNSLGKMRKQLSMLDQIPTNKRAPIRN